MERSRPSVIFDLGEVLVTPTGLFEALRARLGIAAPALERAYWQFRDDYDLGLSDDDYWRRVLAVVGGAVDPARVIEELVEIDVDIWSRIRASAAAILADLVRAGAAVYVLSNAPRALASRVRGQSWSAAVEAFFFSAQLGLRKPDERIYAHAAAAVSRSGDELVFFDDRTENTDAARRAGWRAYHWRSDHQTRGELVALGLLAT